MFGVDVCDDLGALMSKKYELPELDYAYDALEPHLSAEILELHHSKHHQGYVDGANAAVAALEKAREESNAEDKVATIAKNLAFNLAGHINHSLYWKNLAPAEGQQAEGDLRKAIEDRFGSFDQFQKEFNATAMSIQGSGWAALVWDSYGEQLVIAQITDGHQDNHPLGYIPLLMLDMWEHSFYLQYKNVKADYVKAFWNIINWDEVAARYQHAAVHKMS